MKWSWQIARIQGIDVRIHATFFILLAWIAYRYWQSYGSMAMVVEGVVYVIALFGCVVLHEFGHAMMAKRYKVVTGSITLLPIGGVASMDKLPENPKQEIHIALAGPAVNVVIAALLWIWLQLNDVQLSQEDIVETGGPFAYRLMVVNLFLVFFNLLPAFPTDGGRVLRATLALFMPHHRATARATSIGQTFALFFGLLGLLYNPLLLIIAVFLWFAAEMENSSEQMKVSLSATTAADAMLTEFHILSPRDTLQRAIDLTIASDQRDFPVGDQQCLTHVLTQKHMLAALQERGADSLIDSLQLPEIPQVNPHIPMAELLDTLQAADVPVVGVSNGVSVVGLVTLENVLELVQISKALQHD